MRCLNDIHTCTHILYCQHRQHQIFVFVFALASLILSRQGVTSDATDISFVMVTDKEHDQKPQRHETASDPAHPSPRAAPLAGAGSADPMTVQTCSSRQLSAAESGSGASKKSADEAEQSLGSKGRSLTGSIASSDKKRPSAGSVSPTGSMIAEVFAADTDEVRQARFAKMNKLLAELGALTESIKASKEDALASNTGPMEEEGKEQGALGADEKAQAATADCPDIAQEEVDWGGDEEEGDQGAFFFVRAYFSSLFMGTGGLWENFIEL